MTRPAAWARIALWVVLGGTIVANAIDRFGDLRALSLPKPDAWVAYASAAGVALMALVALAVTLRRGWPRVAARRRFQAVPTDNRHLVAFTIMYVTASLPSLVEPPSALEYVWYSLWCLGAPIALLWMWRRGSFRSTLRREWGLHTGTNLLVEIGWGLIAWVACWSLLRTVGSTVSTGGSFQPWWMRPTFLFMTLVYAPVVEETFFRGALYRELRRSLPWFGAALVVTAAFTLIHGLIFGWMQVLLLSVHGLAFCVLREWRDSLVAPMVMHLALNGLPSLVALMFPGVVI